MSDPTAIHRTYAARLRAYFEARPRLWVTADQLVKVGGLCAWRSRLSELRVTLEREGDWTLEWNGNAKASAYRLVEKPIGRRAEERLTQKALF